jgi:hypothetical protein
MPTKKAEITKQDIRCEGCSSVWRINRRNWKNEIDVDLIQCPLCFNGEDII